MPGLLHDHCSAVHPMAVGSPVPELARPRAPRARVALARGRPRPPARRRQRRGDGALDRARPRPGSARTGAPGGGCSSASVASTSTRSTRTCCGRSCTCRSTRSGSPASACRRAAPATLLARRWSTPQARALFGGVAAHAFSPLTRPMSSAVGMALICRLPQRRLAGRARAARGRSPTRSPRSCASTAAGSRPACGCARSPSSTAPTPSLSTSPRRRSPRSPATACRRGSPAPTAATGTGPARFKVDLAVEGGVPWTNEACRRAGTVHVVGSLRGAGRGRARRQPRPDAGAAVRAGRPAVPRRPRALRRRRPPGLGLRPRAERLRRRRDEAVLDQIERFAPGLRERIVATAVRSPGRVRGLQRQLRRRRHHHRRQHPVPDR